MGEGEQVREKVGDARGEREDGCVCVCVCVCGREREIEREGNGRRMGERGRE